MSNGIKLSDTLYQKLKEYFYNEIDTKVLDGITYALATKDLKESVKIQKYNEISTLALKEGFAKNQLFRFLEISNGYIFDIDINMAKYIILQIAKEANQETNGEIPIDDYVKDKPETRRKADMQKLAAYCKSEFKARKRKVEVALYSRNSLNLIRVQAKDKNDNENLICYKAYAIRHWDIDKINTYLLEPHGIKITKITPCEILPSKTGVRFILNMEAVENNKDKKKKKK